VGSVVSPEWFHPSLRKIMHVTVSYMRCMHHVGASRPPLGPVRPWVCEMLGTDFREFLFHNPLHNPLGSHERSFYGGQYSSR
jgi:hypothetical protein